MRKRGRREMKEFYLGNPNTKANRVISTPDILRGIREHEYDQGVDVLEMANSLGHPLGQAPEDIADRAPNYVDKRPI